jgi:broad specificity phosphatase PhoE
MAEVGKTIGEIAVAWRAGKVWLKVGGEAGESPEDLATRAMQGLLSLTQATGGALPPSAVLAVGHAHLNKALLASPGLGGGGLAAIHSVGQENGCINVLELHRATGRWTVMHTNLVPPAPAAGSL